MGVFFILLVCAAVGSCALPGAKSKKKPKAKKYIISASCLPGAKRKTTAKRRTLIGLSKSNLLLCAGTPDAVFKSGASEFLTYTKKGNVKPVGDPLVVGGIPVGTGVVKKGKCIAVVRMQSGKVAALSYHKAGTGIPADPKSCGPLFKKCLSGTSNKNEICHPGLKGSTG